MWEKVGTSKLGRVVATGFSFLEVEGAAKVWSVVAGSLVARLEVVAVAGIY